jgi:hypothetical protein
MRRFAGFGVLLAFGLASCAKPPVVAVAPPPPAPVGHPYHILVEVPPSPYKRHPLTAEQQAEIQQAFNVIGLKSSLMVGALSCNQQSEYDAFMTNFQPHILAEQHVMDAYFKKIGGHYGQAREDDFVTLMANNQSVSGIGQGAIFCLNNQAEFQQVLALKTPDDLDNFVTAQSPDPAPVVADTAPAATVVTHSLKKNKSIKVAEAQN